MHIDEGVPIFEIKEKYGLDPAALKYFCKLYKKWGPKAFKTDGKPRTYTREMKLKAIHTIIAHEKSQTQVALELMLTDQKIVGDWMEKYRNGGEEAIKDTHSREAYKHHDDKILEKEYKKLLEDYLRTKAENDYLKKSFPLALERSKQSKKK